MVESVSKMPTVPASLVPGLRDRPSDKIPQAEFSGRKRELTSAVSSIFRRPDESLDDEELTDAVSRAQDVLNNVDSRIKLSVERDLQRVVIKVVDGESGEVIRQIPPEEVLNLQRFFHDRSGLLLKEEA